MAKKRSSRSKKKKNRTALRDRIDNINWPAVRRGATAASWVIGLVAIVIGWTLGVPRLEAYAVQKSSDITPEVTFPGAPRWMSGDLHAQITLTARRQLTNDILAREDLIAICDVLLETGWFDEIHQVRRVRADLIEIDAAFVQPYALIRDRNGDHLVDSGGRLLPRTYPAGEKDAFVVILNTRYARPQRAREHWEGADVTAALRLIRVIEDQTWCRQARAVDVSSYSDNEMLTIITDRESKIIWGSAPGDALPGESLTNQKLEYLDYHMSRHGHIDRNHAGTVDITSPVAVIER